MPPDQATLHTPRAPHLSAHMLFYVWTPDFTHMSSGVRCLHLLCHHLNRLGYKSYVSTPVTNPSFSTPFADHARLDQFRQDGLADIVIYPEIVAGNPLHAPRVVRYLLNRPGYFTGVGAEAYGADDFFLHYAEEFVPAGLNSLPLRIPVLDTEIYRLPERPVERNSFAVYAARYQPDLASFPAWVVNPELISAVTPRLPESLAKLYQRSRALITGERTAACIEAIHCGCPVIILPNKAFNHQPFVSYYNGGGFCVGFDEVALVQATKTAPFAREKYQERVRSLDKSIEAFVVATRCHFGL
jgi:hypothetical protein